MTNRNRRITVVFTDLEDDEGAFGLGHPYQYKSWLVKHLEGLRDIEVESVEIRDTVEDLYTWTPGQP